MITIPYNEIDGLNGWFSGISLKSIGNFVSNNVKSASNDTSNFVKKHATLSNLMTAVSIAAIVIPAGQAVGIGLKLAKLSQLAKVAKLATGAQKLLQSPIGQAVMAKIQNKQPLTQQDSQFVDQVAVAQDVDSGTPNILDPNEFKALAGLSQQQANQPTVQLPVEVKKALINSNPEITTPTNAQVATLANVKNVSQATIREELENQIKTKIDAKPKDNSVLYAVGGLAVVGLIAFAISKNN